MHVCISISEGTPPPAEGEIKHVEFNGEDETKYTAKYKKVENTLIFEYLKSEESSLYEQLMIVTFNTMMAEDEDIKFCEDVLKRGIFCDDYYNFLGYSESQLSSRTCYFIRTLELPIRKHLEKFGDFFEIKDMGLRAKKIGLLFSPFHQSLKLNENDRIIKKDIKRRHFFKSHTFTNGCGFMSPQFVSNMGRQLRGVKYPEPSAVLVRYQGFAGMLVLREEGPKSHAQVQFHKSMRKLTISNPEAISQSLSFIGVVDHSRPHLNAYLDEKMIMLLAARGVPVENLKSLQKGYFRLLRNMCDDSASAAYFLRLKGRFSSASHVKEGLPALRRTEIKEMIDHVDDPGHEPPRRQVERIRILVPKARVVFGVCDPYNKLEYGECYFQPTLLHDDEQEFAAENEVFVARTPCYHPGDIRVLRFTHKKPGYENLKDCLVLPVKGPRPHSLECAGGDLGGSKFFVCWDPNLIPKTTLKPCSYLPTSFERISGGWAKFRWYVCSKLKKQKSWKEIQDEMIMYFASFTDDLPNQIDKTYMNRAKSSGLSSKQCDELSKLFYQAIYSTVDRDALSKRLAKFELKEGTVLKEQTVSTSEEPFAGESTALLGGAEEGESGLEVRGNRSGLFRQLSNCISRLRFKDPPFHLNHHGNDLNELQEEATRSFVLAIERYLAVASTFPPQGNSHNLIAASVCWIFMTSLTALAFLDNSLFNNICTFLIVSSLLFTLLAYTKVLKCVRRHEQRIPLDQNRNAAAFHEISPENYRMLTMKRYKKSTLTMVYLVGIFILSYIPFMSVKILQNIEGYTVEVKTAYSRVFK